MPDQKWCVWFNDLTTINRAMRKGDADSFQQRCDAIRSREDRAEKRQIRCAKRTDMWRMLDMVLVVACALALAVLVMAVVS